MDHASMAVSQGLIVLPLIALPLLRPMKLSALSRDYVISPVLNRPDELDFKSVKKSEVIYKNNVS